MRVNESRLNLDCFRFFLEQRSFDSFDMVAIMAVASFDVNDCFIASANIKIIKKNTFV